MFPPAAGGKKATGMAKNQGYNAVKRLRGRAPDKRGGRPPASPDIDRTANALAVGIDAYLKHLAVVKRSPLTIARQREMLNLFLRWTDERGLTEPGAITRAILESYQRSLHHYRKKNGKPLSVSAQLNRLSTIKQLFAWLTRTYRIDANPASELELPRREKRLPPEPLTIREVEAVLNVPSIPDPLGVRDRAILELFYSTGIRRSELVCLKVTDLQREKSVLFVRQGKGAKDRVVPVGSRALAWCERYLDQVRPRLMVACNEQSFFLTAYGEAFNALGLGRMVTAYIRRADIGRKSGSCHLLRHSCATHMLEGGADIRYIQQLLGHANLETTAIYTYVSINELRAVHARCHPAERVRQD